MFKNKKTVIFFTLIVVLSLVLTLGCSRNNSESQGNDQNNEPVEEPQKLTIEELYPLNVGDYWKYAGTGNEFAPFEQKVLYREDNRVQLQMVNPGTTLGMVYEFQEGQLVVVYSQEELYDEENILMRENTMESVILQEPIEVGTTWKTADNRTFEITDISATVETPAGKFTDCVEVVSTFEGYEAVNTMSYKPSLGLVKQVYEEGEFKVTQELEEFKVATYNE